ncbi:MAG TPA: hypothetical protein VKG78_01715 [Opitutaceae bacterium]|nr:hypothetical protein [Opitutaceae bacterium]
MRSEDRAWTKLREHAAARISPGFPDRVLRAARDGASPLFVAHFAMCAATAAVCVVAVALYHVRASGDEAAQSIAGWGEIAAQASDLEQGL